MKLTIELTESLDDFVRRQASLEADGDREEYLLQLIRAERQRVAEEQLEDLVFERDADLLHDAHASADAFRRCPPPLPLRSSKR